MQYYAFYGLLSGARGLRLSPFVTNLLGLVASETSKTRLFYAFRRSRQHTMTVNWTRPRSTTPQPPKVEEKPYSYPLPNSEMIRKLKLEKNSAGGYFAESGRSKKEIPDAQAGEARSYHSTIYYALTPKTPFSYFHCHASDSLHSLHQGRARIICLEPPEEKHGWKVHHWTLGNDLKAGEELQLTVPAHWWRCLELPQDDLEKADEEHIGVLMSLTCVPGWSPKDHQVMTSQQLREVCTAAGHLERFDELSKFIQPIS